MVDHAAQYLPLYGQHCHNNRVYSGFWNFPKVQKFCDHFWYSTCCMWPSKGAYLKDKLFLCEYSGVNVVSYPANEQVSSSIPGLYICYETYIGKLSLSGWISFISCTLMVENISGITFSVKYLYDGIAYNKQTLLKSRENRYLLQWERVKRLSLSFLLCSMSLSCAAGCHNSTNPCVPSLQPM